MMSFLESRSSYLTEFFSFWICFLFIDIRLNLFGYHTELDLKKKSWHSLVENLDFLPFSDAFLRVSTRYKEVVVEFVCLFVVDIENLTYCNEEKKILSKTQLSNLWSNEPFQNLMVGCLPHRNRKRTALNILLKFKAFKFTSHQKFTLCKTETGWIAGGLLK